MSNNLTLNTNNKLISCIQDGIEIKRRYNSKENPNRKHLFAVGIYQMIPDTLHHKNKKGIESGFLPWLKKQGVTIDEKTQKFDKDFQNIMSLFFWEDKRKDIRWYLGKTGDDSKVVSTEDAAYLISQEWASMGVPKGKHLSNKTTLSKGGLQGYYDDDGVNAAHVSGKDVIKALEETKNMIEEYGGYDLLYKEGIESLKNSGGKK